MTVYVGGVRDAKLDDASMKQLTDDFATGWYTFHLDQRTEISLLALFSYDKLSTVAREKGWI